MEKDKKVCENCKGKGRINFRYERQWENTSWVPTEGEWVEREKSDICTKCDGKGYLTLKWT